MAGYIANGMAIDYRDGEGSAMVSGRLWRWEFNEYCGPMFLRKGGEMMRRQPGEKHPVWDEFSKWLKKYNAVRAKAKSHEIVRV